MKKFLTVLVIAAAMTACNGSGSASKADSAVSAAADTTKATIDSAAVKVDSTIKAVADTANAKMGKTVDSAKKAMKK